MCKTKRAHSWGSACCEFVRLNSDHGANGINGGHGRPRRSHPRAPARRRERPRARAAVGLASIPLAHRRRGHRPRRSCCGAAPLAHVGFVHAGGLSITTVTVPVTTGTIQQTVASSGTLEPASQANLNFAVSGTVTAVNVKAGQTVTAGEVLATVDTTALTEEVNTAQAQLTSAEDRLSSDEAATSPSQSTIDSDEASVTSAESSLSTAQTNLDDASLTSTIAGTVASVNLTAGQLVTGTGSTGAVGTGSGGTGSTGAEQRRCGQWQHGKYGQQLGSDRRDRHRLLHHQHDGRRHPDRPDRPGRPGCDHPRQRLDVVGGGRSRGVVHGGLNELGDDLWHRRIHQPGRQPELQRHDVPCRRRRDGEPIRPLCRSERRRVASSSSSSTT